MVDSGIYPNGHIRHGNKTWMDFLMPKGLRDTTEDARYKSSLAEAKRKYSLVPTTSPYRGTPSIRSIHKYDSREGCKRWVSLNFNEGLPAPAYGSVIGQKQLLHERAGLRSRTELDGKHTESIANSMASPCWI